MTIHFPNHIRHGLLFLMAFAIALSFYAAPASAQQSEPEQPAAEEKPAGPQPIPASKISILAEETNNTIRSLRDRPTPQEAVVKVAGGINDALELYETTFAQTEESLNGTISFREFEDLERGWLRAQTLIADWQSQVTQRAQSVDRDLETLQGLRRSWVLTLETAGETGLQAAHIEIAQTAAAALKELENQFGRRRAELSTLQGQISRAAEIIEEALRQISKAKSEFHSKISAFEAPPVWQLIADPPPRAEYAEALRGVWDKSRSGFREFVGMYSKDLIAFGIFYLGLLALFIYLRRRTGQLADHHQKFEASLRALAHPISSSLVVCLTLLLVFFPKAPRTVDDIIVLVLFAPLYKTLPSNLMQGKRGAFFTLVFVAVLGRFADVLPFLSGLQRTVLLVMSITALVAFSRLPRATGIQQIDSKSAWVRRVLIARAIAMLMLVVAIIANLIGDVTLAALLTNVLIMSTHLGLLLYALYLILEGVLWVGLSTDFARQFRMVERHEKLVRLRLLLIFRIGFVVLWITETAKFLNIFELVDEVVIAVLTAEARFGEVGVSLGDILAFIITVWASVWVSKLLRFVLEEDVFPRLVLPRGVPQAISTGIHYVVLLFGFFLAIAATGVELSKFTLLAGAFGVGVGFGLQNVVNNFVSGLILLAERPIMPGDTVQIGELAGEVKRIGMRSSTVRTWHGAEVIVPNGNLISNEVINWTLSDKQRRIDINVGVAYGTDPETVTEILSNVGASHPEVLKHPPAYALFLGFGDSSLDFELRVWTVEFSKFLLIKSEVSIAVEKALKQAGITIPFPQRDLHIKSPDETPAPMPTPAQTTRHEPEDNTESGVGEEDADAPDGEV